MKANSERVRGKNFRDLAGKPLFRWVLDSLLEVPAIDQVVINTDAREILAGAGLVSGGRVLVRDRKSEICGDFVSMNLVLADDVAEVESDIYLMTHTTNPLLPASTIGDALGKFAVMLGAGSHDSMFSVNKVQTRFYRQDGSAVNHDPANLVRTQDLEPWFEENSNFYLFTRDSFLGTSARIGKRPAMYDMRRIESVDIDDADDWAVAEALAKSLVAGGSK
ncbi:MAG: acylneuraminate cytidylyltransferase family protein [Fibrobacterota bacterium]|nr:MAG: acylneuraminate cytidylyltransferase family protein [Fibrobacterota bacterium]